MSDIVERLREMENDMIGPYRLLTLEAADEVERLRREVERLRLDMARKREDVK